MPSNNRSGRPTRQLKSRLTAVVLDGDWVLVNRRGRHCVPIVGQQFTVGTDYPSVVLQGFLHPGSTSPSILPFHGKIWAWCFVIHKQRPACQRLKRKSLTTPFPMTIILGFQIAYRSDLLWERPFRVPNSSLFLRQTRTKRRTRVTAGGIGATWASGVKRWSRWSMTKNPSISCASVPTSRSRSNPGALGFWDHECLIPRLLALFF